MAVPFSQIAVTLGCCDMSDNWGFMTLVRGHAANV
jgi:hypothetical protein